MEIIRHGDHRKIAAKKNPMKTFECVDCGCVFRCGKELFTMTFDRNTDFYQATCPECEGRAPEKTGGW